MVFSPPFFLSVSFDPFSKSAGTQTIIFFGISIKFCLEKWSYFLTFYTLIWTFLEESKVKKCTVYKISPKSLKIIQNLQFIYYYFSIGLKIIASKLSTRKIKFYFLEVWTLLGILVLITY